MNVMRMSDLLNLDEENLQEVRRKLKNVFDAYSLRVTSEKYTGLPVEKKITDYVANTNNQEYGKLQMHKKKRIKQKSGNSS